MNYKLTIWIWKHLLHRFFIPGKNFPSCMIKYVKLRYCEKATKFEKIFQRFSELLSDVKIQWEICLSLPGLWALKVWIIFCMYEDRKQPSPPEGWKTNFWVYAVTSKTYAKVNCCLWSSLKWEQRFFVVLASCFEWEKRERKKYYHFQSLNWLTLFCVGFDAASAALQGHPWQSIIKNKVFKYTNSLVNATFGSWKSRAKQNSC